MNWLNTSAGCLRGDLGDVLDEEVDLRRTHGVVLRVDQGRVEGELTELGQRAEDRHPVAPGKSTRPRMPPLPREVGVVDLPVPGRQHHREHLLLLRRQLGRDRSFGATQQERPDALAA